MMNPVYRLFSTSGNLAPAILRMMLAAVFCVHGGQKTLGWMGGAGWSGTLAQWTDPHGFNLSYPVAALGILAEAACAVTMLLGFLTRPACLVIVCTMAISISAVRWSAGFLAPMGYEYEMTLGAVAFSLFCSGAGGFSLDRLITRWLLPPNTGVLGSYRTLP